MDELTNYVIEYYPGLMTPAEAAAKSCIFWAERADASDSAGMRRMKQKKAVSTNPDVLRMLENGPEQFYRDVVKRVMQEHPDEVFLNYCPRCGGLARTPWARQCQHCFFSWHEPK